MRWGQRGEGSCSWIYVKQELLVCHNFTAQGKSARGPGYTPPTALMVKVYIVCACTLLPSVLFGDVSWAYCTLPHLCCWVAARVTETITLNPNPPGFDKRLILQQEEYQQRCEVCVDLNHKLLFLFGYNNNPINLLPLTTPTTFSHYHSHSPVV